MCSSVTGAGTRFEDAEKHGAARAGTRPPQQELEAKGEEWGEKVGRFFVVRGGGGMKTKKEEGRTGTQV